MTNDHEGQLSLLTIKWIARLDFDYEKNSLLSQYDVTTVYIWTDNHRIKGAIFNQADI